MLVGTSTGDLLTLTPSVSGAAVATRSGARDRVEPASTLTSTTTVTAPNSSGDAEGVPESLTGEPPTGLFRQRALFELMGC